MSEESHDLESSVAEIAEELASLAERLNEVAMALLGRAIEEGTGERPEMERRVSKARRTVERAVAQLRTSGGPDDD